MEQERTAQLKSYAVARNLRSQNLVWRVQVHEGMFAHLALAEGDLWAQNISMTALRSLPGLAEVFDTEVPAAYVAVDLNDEGYSTALITCPCGETHACEVGTTIVADCDRAFYWFGHEVRVGRLTEDGPTPD